MRELSKEDAKNLGATAEHYTAYVGPPSQYDFMGATQFRLLCTLGLREQHKLLDYGCGSLRAGRLFIPYLNSGCYYGVEPNKWLIEDSINNEIGKDIIKIKNPNLLFTDQWSHKDWDVKFDYILAQSIFSHCGVDLTTKILSEFSHSLEQNGIAAVTFIHTAEGEPNCSQRGWFYPGQAHYSENKILSFIENAGLFGIKIPWFHPRQAWYLLSKNQQKLPPSEYFKFLTGSVLFNDELKKSLETIQGRNTTKLKKILNIFKRQ